MASGRFDRGAAAERITELERRTLRLHAAVLRRETFSALDRDDKVTLDTLRGGKGRYEAGNSD
jgi:hypothetical protein